MPVAKGFLHTGKKSAAPKRPLTSGNQRRLPRFFLDFFFAEFKWAVAASSRRLFAAQPFLLIWWLRATPSDSAGTFLLIAEPAAIYAPSPIFTGAMSTESLPTKTRLPIVVWCLFTPS